MRNPQETIRDMQLLIQAVKSFNGWLHEENRICQRSIPRSDFHAGRIAECEEIVERWHGLIKELGILDDQ